MDKKSLIQCVQKTVILALAEDCAQDDITSKACVDEKAHVCAELFLKQDARIAGLLFLPWILNPVQIAYQIDAEDGLDYKAGTLLATLEGNALQILKIERTLLNLLQHACGIATITAQFVSQVKGCKCAIVDTRKTLPGLRAIQKYAVSTGGGKNHRFDLKERVLIKTNHLRLIDREGAISFAIQKARAECSGVSIEVEVNSLDQFQQALDAAPDAILLDNMTPQEVKRAVKRNARKVFLEASGGITLSNVRAYAETGVDAVSIGALTHSAPAVDISLRM